MKNSVKKVLAKGLKLLQADLEDIYAMHYRRR
jgi:hypothetical protein